MFSNRIIPTTTGLLPLFSRLNNVISRAVVFRENGEPSEKVKVEDLVMSSPGNLKHGQVLIEMLAAPINPSDLNQVEGTYAIKSKSETCQLCDVVNADEPEVKVTSTEEVSVGGNEGVARVIAFGPRLNTGVKANQPADPFEPTKQGQWVIPRISGNFGTWASYQVVPAETLFAISDFSGLQPATVASLKVNPSTGYRLLTDFSDLKPGDYVIQNAANSGVGEAVIQIAHYRGIRTINIVRDRPDWDAMETRLRSLGADVVVRDTFLADTLKKGKDAVAEWLKQFGSIKLGLNTVGGRSTTVMMNYLAEGATLVTYGGMSRQPVTVPTSLLIFKDIRFRGFWMSNWYKQHEAKDAWLMWADLLKLMRSGIFQPQEMVDVHVNRDVTTQDKSSFQKEVTEAMKWGKKHIFVFRD